MGARKPRKERADTGQQDSDPRDRFFDDASHELRIPITTLKGHIQLMQRRLRKDPNREEDVVDLDRMLYQVQRLNHQLDVLLASTQIRQNRYAILLAPCDIVALARQLVAIYSAGTTSHAIRLESSVDELIGDWDRRRIEEALAALLSNAIKYSPPGSILVLMTRLGEVAHVEVQDKGLGVPTRERSAIFHAYTTGSRAESSGIGLGLYVAREAIRRQHGRIGVRSGEGSGSSFWFDLPLQQPVPRSRRPTYRRSNHAAARPASAISITQTAESPKASTYMATGVL